MQSHAKASHATERAPSTRPPPAVTRSVSRPLPLLMRSACACGGTCPHCAAEGQIKGAAEARGERARATCSSRKPTASPITSWAAVLACQSMPASRSTCNPAHVRRLRGGRAGQRRCSGNPVARAVAPFRRQPNPSFSRWAVAVHRCRGPEAQYYESRFGRSFGDVRIHTGATADAAAKSINARAFTLGNDIAFANGERDFASDPGRRLMAHELTHTVQQSSGVGYVQRGSAGLFGGKCCNPAKRVEWALVGAGDWKQLEPGACTGTTEDCDGMTCGGGFYRVENLKPGVVRHRTMTTRPLARGDGRRVRPAPMRPRRPRKAAQPATRRPTMSTTPQRPRRVPTGSGRFRLTS